ncbi:Phosphoglycerate kinase [Candidatus Bilamarchaeum dharawalense]|uniref:Phosphoglycerate kinase n=1 Tax=Candidatus Bilamarchaeum dharawalense TaxID=2885759 RepID=A0A5E4LS70_9ARCH|nr:Phosphoglycerate kinase [Candidatus Bilamarchaeum dharawalense]
MRKIADYDVKGKRILVRVDLNCPVKDGKIIGDTRLRAHAITIKELSDRGGRLIVLSHQGRKGKEDFLSLEQHAKRLHQLIGRDVIFIDALVSEKAVNAIKSLNDGDIIVLDNVRHLHCETEHPHGEGEIIHHLSPVADYYVLDALSVAHRKHSSVVGFSKRIPSFAGDILAAEVEAVEKVRHGRDTTFIFGGSKVEDSFEVMKRWLAEGRARHILVGGALSVLMLYATGHSVGDSLKYLEDSGLMEYVPAAKELVEKNKDKIVLPVDVAVSIDNKRQEVDVGHIKNGQIWDIGEKTIEKYKEIIANSHTIVMNGPAGVYEIDDFAKGTRSLLEAVAKSKAFSLLGGGHTLSALDRFNLNKKHFGYVSLSGKALIEYLCGAQLPGIVALDDNEKKFQLNDLHHPRRK